MFRLSGYLNLQQIAEAIQLHLHVPLEHIAQSWPENATKLVSAWVDNTIVSILQTVGEVTLYHPSETPVRIDYVALRILPDGTQAAEDFGSIEPPLTIEKLEQFHLSLWQAHSLIHPGTCVVSFEGIEAQARNSAYVKLLEPFEGFGVLVEESEVVRAIATHKRWINEDFGDPSSGSRRGRPLLQEAALAAYLEAFPHGHGDRHWSMVEDRVAEIAGRKIHHRTIRRALEGKLGQNGQNSGK